jgi:uncharacterized protein (TIGR02118 family)
MLKLDILIIRRQDFTHRQFLEYWRDRHAPLFVEQPIVQKTVRRYVQSRTLPETPAGLPSAPFDGIAQLWFDDADGFLEYVQSPNYRDVIRLDEIKFVDPTRVQFLFSEEKPILG